MEPIEGAVDAWLKTTKRARPVLGADDPAAALRDRLWKPVAARLGGATTVLVSPDGALARLPFAALPGAGEGKYLVEEIAVSVVPVPQFLPDLVAPMPAGAPSLLVVGEVDYGVDPGKPAQVAAARSAVRGGETMSWDPLGHTKSEMVDIKDTFEQAHPGGAVRALRKGQPTEAAVRAALGGSRWVPPGDARVSSRRRR